MEKPLKHQRRLGLCIPQPDYSKLEESASSRKGENQKLDDPAHKHSFARHARVVMGGTMGTPNF